MMRPGLVSLLFSLLIACSKAPDLYAPCREFGKYCAQQPINEVEVMVSTWPKYYQAGT